MTNAATEWKSLTALVSLASGAVVLLAAEVAGGAVVVDATVSPVGGGIFHYDVAITNSEAEDLVLVSLLHGPLSDPYIEPSLTAPAGFLTSYDDGLGIVDFLADSALFNAGSTTSGFSFNSVAAPMTAFGDFEALGDFGGSFRGLVNLTVTAVPEPGALALLALGSVALAGAAKRRRRLGQPG